jgi:hypothetical protein
MDIIDITYMVFVAWVLAYCFKEMFLSGGP